MTSPMDGAGPTPARDAAYEVEWIGKAMDAIGAGKLGLAAYTLQEYCRWVKGEIPFISNSDFRSPTAPHPH